MEKRCPVHGAQRVRIAKHSWYYEGLDRFYRTLAGSGHALSHRTAEFYFLVLTRRCNLGCHICFASAEQSDAKEDVTLDEVERRVRGIVRRRRRVAIIGGEPTVRDDLPQVIRIISGAGHRPWLFSNGLRLVDRSYLQELVDAGLDMAWVWTDALSDDTAHEQIRGRALLADKLLMLSNLQAARVPTGLTQVVVRGINEGEVAAIVDHCRRNAAVESIGIRGYSDLGRQYMGNAKELGIDELVELVAQVTGGLVTMREFFLFQKLMYAVMVGYLRRPLCYNKQSILLPRGDRPRFRDLFDLDRLERALEELERDYAGQPARARVRLARRLLPSLVRNPRLVGGLADHLASYLLGRRISPLGRDYVRLGVARFFSAHDYDGDICRQRCNDVALLEEGGPDLTDYCTSLLHEKGQGCG